MQEQLPSAPGIHEVTLQPANRRITLALPPDIGEHNPSPLVIALHYGGPNYPFKGGQMLRNLVEPALRPLHALIAAPDCNHGDWANEQSEAEVLALLERLQEAYTLDPARTLLTGVSLGGIGAWLIGGRNQDRFAAVLPLSAAPPAAAVALDWQIPLLVIHSHQDEHFPPAQVKDAVARLRARGAEVETLFLTGVIHYEVDRLRRPLASAVPWIEQVWARGRERAEKNS